MEVLAKIYWIRVASGAVAGLLSTGLILLWPLIDPSTTLIEVIAPINTLLNGITVALFVYIVSYYILKLKYVSRLEKPSKVATMGIFIYFFTWLIVWVLTLTAIIGPI